MALIRVIATVTGVAIFGMLLGAAFGWGAATIALSFFSSIIPWKNIEPVGFATVLGAFSGVICGGVLGSAADQLTRSATNPMTRTLLTLFVLLVVSGPRSLADEKAFSVGDLNHMKVIGELGVPLHTVHRVECRVVDMSFTSAKADDGRLAFQIVSVDGKSREEKHYIDIPNSPEGQKPKIGQVHHPWAYETVATGGYPTEAFEKIGELSFATQGLHFRSKLVVLKTLTAQQAEQVSGGNGGQRP